MGVIVVAKWLLSGRSLHIDAMTSILDRLGLANGALDLTHLDTFLGHRLRLSFLQLRSARCCRHHQVYGLAVLATVHEIGASITVRTCYTAVHRCVPKDPLLDLLANLVQQIFPYPRMAQHHRILLLRLQVGRTLDLLFEGRLRLL